LDWRPFIPADPDILVGKRVAKGTRLAVDFILRLLANGGTEQQILESYPSLTAESLRAVVAYGRASEI
jgi:uncharacterized protein (DUF433 family)